MMHPIRNDYIRKLSAQELADNWQPPSVEGDILITPDGFRWRVEGRPTVGELIHIGDTIRSSYGTTGIVKHVTRWEKCCCPRRGRSHYLICEDSWEGPASLEYHIPVITWSLVYVPPSAKQDKAGRFYDEADHCFINELVAVGGRILALFENNSDEVFVIDGGVTRPVQFALW